MRDVTHCSLLVHPKHHRSHYGRYRSSLAPRCKIPCCDNEARLDGTLNNQSSDKHYHNKKHLKNVGPIRHCEPFYIAIHQVSLQSHAATVARRLRIDVHNNDDDDDNDNA